MKTKQFKSLSLIVMLTLVLSLAGLGAVPRPAGAAPSLAPEATNASMPAPLLTFAGQSRAAPDAENQVPDTSGDAGRTRYIQAVNESVQIFYKDGTPVTASTPFESFWADADTGTACDGLVEPNGGGGNHHGQPNVLYDDMAQRWFVMDLAYAPENVDNGPYFFCIAVSNANVGEMPDELNSNDWYFYALQTTASWPHFLPDQPRVGLWPDGYYIAADMYDVYNNGFNRTPHGVKVWALNRDDLVNHGWQGNPLVFRVKDFQLEEELGYHGLLPANMRGVPPATGTPNYLTAVLPPNQLLVWKFYVDWIHNTAALNFTPTTLYMDTTFSWAQGFFVPQPGVPDKLAVLGDRLSSVMYRELDGVTGLWASHTVMNPAGGTDIRWYEVRGLTSSPFLYQQGVYHPDSYSRWISSLAVDGEGNMALGFSKSSTTLYPSIYYAGRLDSDPLNALPQTETELARFGDPPFNGYQDIVPANPDEPWGRKSSMTVDPVDDCIFWYTNEYFSSQSPQQWLTRIGWFRFPTCKAGTTARISLHTNNTQGNGASGQPLEQYSVGSSKSGRWVSFTSEASNLVDNDSNGVRDIFVRDRDVDQDGIYDEPGQVATVRVSLSTAGAQANGNSWETSITYDGRWVVFSSDASNLVSGDTNGTRDIFVRDRDTDLDGVFDEAGAVSTFRVSIPDGGGQSNAQSDQPSIAVFYGQTKINCSQCVETYLYVAYRSFASNLVADDTNNFSDIYVWISTPWGTGTERASESSFGDQADNNSYTPSIAANYWSDYDVAFTSDATNLVGGDGNGVSDVFVRNRWSGVTSRVSIDSLGTEGNGPSYHPSISGDTNWVAFISRASNLVTPPALPDTNGLADVFVRNRIDSETFRISVSFVGAQANGDSYTPSISWDGQFVAFASDANNLDLVVDSNGVRDIFLTDGDTGLTKRISYGYNGQPDGMSIAPVVSGDGRHVAFPSRATNLVTNDTNNVWDVFAHDREGYIPTFLTVASNVPANPGQQVSVPVYFTGFGQSIDTTAFSIDFDEECLTYVSTTFTLPAGFEGAVTPDLGDTDGELDFAIKFTTAGASLPDSTLLSIKFLVSNTCQTAPDTSRSARVGFSNDPRASFGKNGASIRGKTADGFVEIFSGILGDCNADGLLDAGDISALVLEIFDNDGDVPANTPKGTFKGNAVGCNPNQDIVVDAGDISCDLLLIFGKTCSGANSLSSQSALKTYQPEGKPAVRLPLLLSAGKGATLTVPVSFAGNGQAINNMTFAVEYDAARLELEDAAFSLPGAFSGSTEALGAGKLGVKILGPLQAALPDGQMLTLTFTVKAQVVGTDAAVVLSSSPRVSAGNTTGQSPVVDVTDARQIRKLYVPFLIRR